MRIRGLPCEVYLELGEVEAAEEEAVCGCAGRRAHRETRNHGGGAAMTTSGPVRKVAGRVGRRAPEAGAVRSGGSRRAPSADAGLQRRVGAIDLDHEAAPAGDVLTPYADGPGAGMPPAQQPGTQPELDLGREVPDEV